MPIRARRFLMETDNESVHGWRTPCVVETSLGAEYPAGCGGERTLYDELQPFIG